MGRKSRVFTIFPERLKQARRSCFFVRVRWLIVFFVLVDRAAVSAGYAMMARWFLDFSVLCCLLVRQISVAPPACFVRLPRKRRPAHSEE